ncbi:TAXI family TRAP transporter solute-binding subunit [Clostridium sp. AM58-1XD]|uniref:TAXI family TRAP transporter solute-binding subunit n=1 Tax=Clostridium sp. AM58-1XD TaxID=2292307 RepID=UPI000E52748B|nr:TAXI family TRAP transporter solute-binding subunit [Clostridium sp. AM58-1XD]RGY99902.1 hypothetical protein DXA13_06755 [Clostridium sp. AM58-1XD]
MKKGNQIATLLSVLAITVFLSACSKSPGELQQTSEVNDPEGTAELHVEANGPVKLHRLSMATGGTTGGMYIVGGGIANVLLQNINNIDIAAEVTGGTLDNLGFLQNGSCELGLSNADFAQWAYEGTDPFTEKHDILSIGALFPSAVHIIASKSSGIESVADMAGKKIGVGPLGSGNRLNSEKILGFYDLSFDDITPYDYNNGEMIDALKDGDIDGIILITGAPVSKLIDLFMTTDADFVTLGDEMTEEFIKQYSYFQKLTLPADLYGTDEDVSTIAVTNLLLVRSDLEDEVVYWITRGIFENLEAVRQVHTLVSDLSPEEAVNTSVPLHPGAERYYREAGIIK